MMKMMTMIRRRVVWDRSLAVVRSGVKQGLGNPGCNRRRRKSRRLYRLLQDILLLIFIPLD